MKYKQNIIKSFFCLIIISTSCENNKKTEALSGNNLVQDKVSLINKNANTIKTRFNLPQGFIRKDYPENSFESYLENFLLLPDSAQVIYYDGKTKNKKIHAAVLDIDVGDKDLQQCADAIIRLRAEYLFKQNKYSDIHFKFTNNFVAEYNKWAEGYRIQVNGNKTHWIKSVNPDYSYQNFKKYIFYVYNYAGTISLAGELKYKEYKDLEIGDVFIQGGSPGHAMIVMDVAVNSKTGNKIYLLAQSYMPAQSIHIVKNLQNLEISPWFEVNENNQKVQTPEWSFKITDLKKF